jgi:hypothetical protein
VTCADEIFGGGRKLTTTITPATPLNDHGAPENLRSLGQSSWRAGRRFCHHATIGEGAAAMSLSAERMAIANRAIQQTLEQASIVWQAVPHWDTGDPGQVMVRNELTFAIAGVTAPPVPQPPKTPFGADPIPLVPCHVRFQMTLAQTTAPTPDALLAGVMSRTVELAQQFDKSVLAVLSEKAIAAPKLPDGTASPWYPTLATPTQGVRTILTALVNGRQLIEDSGYRAQSCLIASTAHFIDLNQWVGSNVATEGLLLGGNANSLLRATQLDKVPVDDGTVNLMLMLGRRQQIAHGCASAASPGEEPVDLAISVPPSLEVIGENAAGEIELAVRIRFATRVKDERGVVVFHT